MMHLALELVYEEEGRSVVEYKYQDQLQTFLILVINFLLLFVAQRIFALTAQKAMNKALIQ